MKHMEWRFTVGDKSWMLDIGPLTVDDYIDLQRLTGYGVTSLLNRFDDMDPLVLKAMLWMARRKSGEDIAFNAPEMSFTMQDLRIVKVRDDLASADSAAPDGETPGPTKAPSAPKPRKRTTTSKAS